MRFLLALLISAPFVCAQTVVVTGTAGPLPLEEADRDITVLPLPRTERVLFNSWFEALQLDPALNLQQRSPGGFIADLSIRGATFGQTLVLLDGMRINDAQTGHFNLDLPVPFDVVSGIEVLKGAGSTLYGSDAIGGVVNVRTRQSEGPELRLLGGLGNFGTNEEHGVASFGNARYSEQLGFARDFSSGFAADRDYRNLSVSSMTGVRSKLGSTSLLMAYSDKPYGADQFYGNYPSWERIKTWFASAHQDFGDKTEASFAYRRHTDLFVLYRYSPQIYTNRHLLDSWQGDLRRHDNLPFHAVLSYGAEGFGESITSTNLGIRSRRRGSGYVFYDIRSVRRYSLSAGIREEVYGSGQVATSPSVSGAAWLSSRVKLRGSASRAFRLPSYTDLYYSDPANKGNPNLKPESATSYEAGVDGYFGPRLHSSVTVFQRRDSNVIDYVRASAADFWQATNFDRLHFTGVEAALVYEPVAGQRVSVSYAGLHGVNSGGTVLLSKYTFNYPVHSAVVEWRGSVAGRLVARTRIGVADQVNRNPYAVWDASAGWSRGRVRPFVQLTNISSTVYQEIPNVALPTRGILGGLEFLLR
jgi:iron complex outermembrane receptor protein